MSDFVGEHADEYFRLHNPNIRRTLENWENADRPNSETLSRKEREGVRKAVVRRYGPTTTKGGHGHWAKEVIVKLLDTCDLLEATAQNLKAEIGRGRVTAERGKNSQD